MPEHSTTIQNDTSPRNPPAPGSHTTLVHQSAASPPHRLLASSRHDAPSKGSHEIKKEEDRLNHVLAQDTKSAARVIYYDTKEFDDWPEIDKDGVNDSHNVSETLPTYAF